MSKHTWKAQFVMTLDLTISGGPVTEAAKLETERLAARELEQLLRDQMRAEALEEARATGTLPDAAEDLRVVSVSRA